MKPVFTLAFYFSAEGLCFYQCIFMQLFFMQSFIHYFFHFGFPFFVAFLFYREQWKKTYMIFLLTMLVDLDHLLADPVFDPCRCSIGFHLLHSYIAIAVYIVLLVIKPLRVIAIGLLMHMATDYLDCLLMNSGCN
jgi:hypothetical protein